MSKLEAGKQAGETALRRAVERFEQRPTFANPKTALLTAGQSNLYSPFVARHNPDSHLLNKWWLRPYSPLLGTQIFDNQVAHRYARLDRSPSYLQLILRLRRQPPLPELEPEAGLDPIMDRPRSADKQAKPVPKYYPQPTAQDYQNLPEILQRSLADFALPPEPPGLASEKFLSSRLSAPEHTIKTATTDFKPPLLQSLSAITSAPLTFASATVPSPVSAPAIPSLARSDGSEGAIEAGLTPDEGEIPSRERVKDAAILAEPSLPTAVPATNLPQVRRWIGEEASHSTRPLPAASVQPAFRPALAPTALSRVFERLESVSTPPRSRPEIMSPDAMEMRLPPARSIAETNLSANLSAQPELEPATPTRSSLRTEPTLPSRSRPQPEVIPPALSQLESQNATPLRPPSEMSPSSSLVARSPQEKEITSPETSTASPVLPELYRSESASPVLPEVIQDRVPVPASEANRVSPESRMPLSESETAAGSAQIREAGLNPNALNRALERTIRPLNFVPGNNLSYSVASNAPAPLFEPLYSGGIFSAEASAPSALEMNYVWPSAQPTTEATQGVLPANPTQNVSVSPGSTSRAEAAIQRQPSPPSEAPTNPTANPAIVDQPFAQTETGGGPNSTAFERVTNPYQWVAQLATLHNNAGLFDSARSEVLKDETDTPGYTTESTVARLASGSTIAPTTSITALARVLQRTRNPLALAYTLPDRAQELAAFDNLNLIYRSSALTNRQPETANALPDAELARSVSGTNNTGRKIIDAPPQGVPSFTTLIGGQPSDLSATSGVAQTSAPSGFFWPSGFLSQALGQPQPNIIARALRRMQDPLASGFSFYLPENFSVGPNFMQLSPLEMRFALSQSRLDTAQPELASHPDDAIPGSTNISRASLSMPDLPSPVLQRQNISYNEPSIATGFEPTSRSYPYLVSADSIQYDNPLNSAAGEFSGQARRVLADEWAARLPTQRYNPVLSRQLSAEQGASRVGENSGRSFEASLEAATPAMALARVLQRTEIPVAELNRPDAANMSYALLRRLSGETEAVPAVSTDFEVTSPSNRHTRSSVEVIASSDIEDFGLQSAAVRGEEAAVSVTTNLNRVSAPLARAIERRESAGPEHQVFPDFAAPDDLSRSYAIPPLVQRKAGDYTPSEAAPFEAAVAAPDRAATSTGNSAATLARAVMSPATPASPIYIASSRPGEYSGDVANNWVANLPSLRHNPGLVPAVAEPLSASDFGGRIPENNEIVSAARSIDLVLPNSIRPLMGAESTQAAVAKSAQATSNVKESLPIKTFGQGDPAPTSNYIPGITPASPSSAALTMPLHPSEDTRLEAAIASEPAISQTARIDRARTETDTNDSPFAEPLPMAHPAPWVQRKASGETLNFVPPIGATLSPATILRTAIGKPLERKVQEQMGAIFRTRLEHVRVHTDDHAADYTRQMGAEALTIGPNILFAPGRYQPETPMGQALIGHELTHVIQQANLPSLSGGRTPETSSAGQAFEHEALHNEKLLLRHLASPPIIQPNSSSPTSQNYLAPSSSNGFSSASTIARSFSRLEPQHLYSEKSSAPSSSTSASPPGLQREMEQSSSNRSRSSAPPIQRVYGEDEGNSNEANIQKIAQEVYRLLKLQLQIDRERSGARGGSIF